MERKMSIHWTGFTILCMVLLLGFGNGALGFIDPGNLKIISNYITQYGAECYHYAVAVRLDADVCKDPSLTKLEVALPSNVVEEMQKAIQKPDGIYVPNPIGNLVAARPNKNEHAEWRLLTGGQNSPTARILENKRDSCLIFLSKLSPCTDRCLNLNDMRNIVNSLLTIFNQIDKDSRAFVFESYYGVDSKKLPYVLVEGWRYIKEAPLFRCNDDNADCIQCFDNNGLVNTNCLTGQVLVFTSIGELGNC